MNRRDFIRITGGVLVAFGPSVRARTRLLEEPDPRYLEHGLTAMARATHWFEAHWGAATIAGSYLAGSPALREDVRQSIRAQLDIAIEKNPRLFEPFDEQEPQPESLATLPRALEPAMAEGLRDHGHAVIYTSLALRALGDLPHLATPSIVDGIRTQIDDIADSHVKRPRGEPASYADTQELVDKTFESLVRFEPLIGRPSIRRPNFTHIVTHTEALTRLERLGHEELVRRGHVGHGVHIGSPVPDSGAGEALDRSEVRLEGILDASFWEDEERHALWHDPWGRRSNPNGDWIASGHLFKVLYAFTTLIERVSDEALVERSAKVLLERYFHPEVQGG